MFFSKFSPKIEDLNLVNKMAELDALFDPYPWKVDHWLAMVDCKDEALFIMQDKDLLGWAVFKLIPADSLAHLLKLLIHPDFRRKGY